MLMERTDSFLIFAEKAQKSEDTLKQLSHEENNDNNNSNFSAGDSEVKVGNGLSLRSRLFSKKLNFGKKEKTKKEETKGEDFVQQVRSLTNSITSLKNFLERNRNDYLSKSVSLLVSSQSPYSEMDRDKIDEQAENLIKLSNTILFTLKDALNRIKPAKETTLNQFESWLTDFSAESLTRGFEINEKLEHRKLVISLLEAYLKEVCDIYSEQKAVRLKSSVERKKFSRLELSANLRSPKDQKEYRTVSQVPQELSSDTVNDPSKDLLSPEEMQQMELENQQLFNDLQGMEDQVKVIEGQVVEISRLQSIFTEKVLSQSEKIESVYMTTVSSTENIKQGNEHIRNAMRNNAGLRFWILFFLVVSSFSLLFLDWYDT
ncbi:syntaxin-18-like [Symsagittifera roscoffensis]|uniref:syntaxin-18-like n=1 Tax=Symsagittifera roscoffensis TaxID=84072 RepID=UPI00307C381D